MNASLQRALSWMSLRALFVLFLCSGAVWAADPPRETDADSAESQSLDVLFIGNSYTARHNLAELVKQLAEAGNPGLTFNPTTIIYGGRTLSDHWRLGSANIVNQHALTLDEQQAVVQRLQTASKDKKDKYAPAALRRHRERLQRFGSDLSKWDIVVLQSYRDDLEGKDSLYAKFVPKFAALAETQGARVVLYVTTPTTQNLAPLTAQPDAQPILRKTKATAVLADSVGADAAPMALVGLRCNQRRPDLTLRFVNDAHLNQTLSYMSACTLYAAIFGKSPEGLDVASVTDIRFWESADGSLDKTKDRDGNPITKTFSKADSDELQQIAWKAHQEFQAMRSVEAR